MKWRIAARQGITRVWNQKPIYRMAKFRDFIGRKSRDEVETAVGKLPPAHRKLVAGFQFQFEDGAHLKNHGDAVGLMVHQRKVIRVAAPWHYAREFCLYHEVAHVVYAHLKPDWRRRWIDLCPSNDDDNCEEKFCHAYANYWAKHKVDKHDDHKLAAFIKEVCSADGDAVRGRDEAGE